MITPFWLSGRFFRSRIMLGMAAWTLACLLAAQPVSAAEIPAGGKVKELAVSRTP
jgi:hypothetical protein